MHKGWSKGWAWAFGIMVVLLLLINGLVYSGWIDFK